MDTLILSHYITPSCRVRHAFVVLFFFWLTFVCFWPFEQKSNHPSICDGCLILFRKILQIGVRKDTTYSSKRKMSFEKPKRNIFTNKPALNGERKTGKCGAKILEANKDGPMEENLRD